MYLKTMAEICRLLEMKLLFLIFYRCVCIPLACLVYSINKEQISLIEMVTTVLF